MKHKKNYLFVCILLTILHAFPSGLRGETGIGYHGANFLKISPAARQVAMGEAATALADDVNLMRYNIGGLGNIRKVSLAASFHNWIGDTQQGNIGLILPSRWGVFGFDFTYFNEGKIEELNQNFQPTGGTAISDDILMNFGYGTYINIMNNNFAVGGSVKFLRQTLAGIQSSSMALDVGTQFRLKHVSFGATIQNFSLTKVKFDNQKSSLPEIYRVGVATRLPVAENLKANLASDVSWTPREKLRYYFGGEVDISELLALRAGYQMHSVAVSPLSLGFGLYIPMEWLANSQSRLDYAYSPLDDFESTAHRFSMMFTFGAATRVLALNERQRLDELSDRLRKELEAAERARIAAQQAEERTRRLEEEIARRLARIQSIAAESEGKIEVEPQDANKILVSMRINFDFDKADIRPEEYPTLRQVAEILRTYPEAEVQLSGHTDAIGTEQYNIRLSQRRVDSVMVHLTKKENIAQSRFFMPIGYGELKPIDTNDTPEGRFRNRRVEFMLFTFDAKPEIPEGSAIKTIEVVDGRTFRIVCNGKVEFTTHTLREPDRFLVDLPGIYLLTDQKEFAINRGLVTRARVGYHPEERFSRVVFDLTGPVDFEVNSIENYIEVKVK